ncbi:MAG: trypsin-like peptidase domain-containing protein [Rubripirellula sp.]
MKMGFGGLVRRIAWAVGITIIGATGIDQCEAQQVDDDSPRMTPLVQVIRGIEPAVISLFVRGEKPNQFGSGSGAIIHPDGYVLTNNHVLPRVDGFAVFRDRPVRFVVVGRLPEKDIALLRLRDVPGDLPTVPLGHSFDVMNGESVVVAGNPGGRGVVFTSGIVSSKRVLLDAPNALVRTQFPNSRHDDFIQFDAASNRGNSGGPLVNMEGELIGIVSALIPKEQNVGFAIPVDRVRELFERVLEPELIYERSVGIVVNTQSDEAVVTTVEPGSIAESVGLRSGDTLTAVNDRLVRHAADWCVLKHQLLPSGKPLQLIVRRGESKIPFNLVPDKKPPFSAVEVADVQPGLQYRLFHGLFTALPDFGSLAVQQAGVVPELDLDAVRGDREDEFACTLSGLLQIEEDGLFRFTLTSDDGSRLFVHDQKVIDHDGDHPPIAASRLVRMRAGLHPVRIEHYEGVGGQELGLKLERFGNSDGKPETLSWFHAANSVVAVDNADDHDHETEVDAGSETPQD